MAFFKEMEPLSGAKFSDCRKWRYVLWRIWDRSKKPLVVIGLNPSTADEKKNDPTVKRCMERAKLLDCGGLYMLNLFAFRATFPSDMKAAKDPIGPRTNEYIRKYAERGKFIIAAWGTHGKFKDRDQQVLELLKDLNIYCLGLTKDYFPIHPLYQPYTAELMIYSDP